MYFIAKDKILSLSSFLFLFYIMVIFNSSSPLPMKK